MDRRQLKHFALRAGLTVLSLTVAAMALRVALRGLDWPLFASRVRLLDWRWLAVAVFFDVLSYGAQGWRWRFLLDGSNVWQTTRAIYAGLFVNEILPLRPGEVLRGWLAARDLNTGIWKVVPTMVSERLLDGFWLVAALLGAVWLAPLPRSVAHGIWIACAIAGTLILVIQWLGGRGGAFLQTVIAGFRNRRAVLLSAAFVLAQGLAFWAVTRASHLSLGLLGAFVVMIVVRIGTLIPGAPANLGTHQFATVMGLSLYGIPHAEAAAFSLVVFTVLTLPLLALGFGACVSAGVTWRGVRQLARQRDVEIA